MDVFGSLGPHGVFGGGAGKVLIWSVLDRTGAFVVLPFLVSQGRGDMAAFIHLPKRHLKHDP